MALLIQGIVSALLSLSCVNMGITFTWPSSTILLFKSENTTLDRPMSDMEITLFTSLPLIGALVGQPLVVLCILDRLGLKYTAILTSFLFVISWSIITLINRVEAILIAVTITGCAYAMYINVAMYIAEIVEDTFRGTLISLPNLAIGVGLVMSYILGGILEYNTMVYSCLSLAIIGFLVIIPLKHPPLSLMTKGKEEEAAKSLAFYRQSTSTSKEVITELNSIRRSLNKKIDDAQSLKRDTEEQNTKIDAEEISSSDINIRSCWQLFKTTPSIRRQLYVVLILHSTYVFQGLPSVQAFAEPIFTILMGDTVSPSLCSIILGLLLIFGGLVGAYLVDKIGRRPLQIYSSILCGICCLLLGIQIVTNWFPKWTTLVFIYGFTITHSSGSGIVPFVVVAEIFLPEVRSKLFMLTNEWAYLCAFSCMFIFSIVVQSYGLAPVFFFFSFVSFTTSIYFFYSLPETKGLPLYAIQTLFVKDSDK